MCGSYIYQASSPLSHSGCGVYGQLLPVLETRETATTMQMGSALGRIADIGLPDATKQRALALARRGRGRRRCERRRATGRHLGAIHNRFQGCCEVLESLGMVAKALGKTLPSTAQNVVWFFFARERLRGLLQAPTELHDLIGPACDTATNSASLLLRVTPPCRELCLETAPPLSLKRYPVIDLRVSGSAAKSLSTQPVSLLRRSSPGSQYVMPSL